MARVRFRKGHALGAALGALLLVTSAGASAQERHGSVFVDPLGFALFGPRVGVEVGHRHLSGALYARWFSPGLLGHSLFLNDNDEFGFSYGVGLRGRYFFGKNLDRAHLGLIAELLRTRVENHVTLIGTTSGYIVPQVEAGYRFAFGRFYIDPAASLGYAARVSNTAENLPGGDPRREVVTLDESSLYGSASLDLGLLF